MKAVIEDFSGGLTDFKTSGVPTQFEIGDNFVLNKDKGLTVRNGSSIFSTVHMSKVDTIRMSSLFNFSDLIHTQSGNKIRYYLENDYIYTVGTVTTTITSGWNEYKTVIGTISISALNTISSGSFISYAEWNGVQIVTSEDFSKPIKIFRDENGVQQIRTAGLPTPESKFPLTIGTLNTTFITGQIAGTLMESGGYSTFVPSAWTTGGSLTTSYSYAFVYTDEYNVQSYSNLDESTPSFATFTSTVSQGTSISGGQGVKIQGIPKLVNTISMTHYNESSISVDIYRTILNGSEYFLLGEMAFDTITSSFYFNDNNTDSSLLDAETLYTSGGILENDEPPVAKYVASANDCIWYMNVKETTKTATKTVTTSLPFRIRQSVPLDVDSCPVDLFIDVDGDIIGGGNVGTYLVPFTSKKTFRIDGRLDELGQGKITKEVVSDVIGCLSHRSIINTSTGIYFAGKDALYFTDGFKIKPLSEKPNQGFSILETYKELTRTDDQKRSIFGSYDKQNGRAFWSFKSEGATECDTVLVYDETYDAFTMWTGGSSFLIQSHLVFNDTFLRMTNGYLLKHDTGDYYDKEISDTVTPTSWHLEHIPYYFRHIAFDFGIKDQRKWVTKITVQSNVDTDINISVRTASDDNSAKTLKGITFINGLKWGDPQWLWGDANVIWNFITTMSKTRRNVTGSLRCRYKQLELVADKKVLRSDDFCKISTEIISSTICRATLIDPSFILDSDILDWHIRTSYDNYYKEYKITLRDNNIKLEFEHDNDAPINGAYDWEIVGYPKDQRFVLNRFIYTYEVLSDHGGYYVKSSEQGTNEDND